jgi:hypothetical protein
MPPHEYMSVTEALKGLRDRGFTNNFEFLNNAFCAVETGRTFNPEELSIREHHRFEGASDPDDSSVVYAIETDDGLRGTIVDAYGIYANSELEAFLGKVKMREER